MSRPRLPALQRRSRSETEADLAAIAMSRLAVGGAPVANLWPLREQASFGVAYNAGRLIGYISGFPDMVPAFASAEQVANIADRLSEVVEAERRRLADAP